MKIFWFIFWIILILLFALTAWLPKNAEGHNAPSGWKYPIECCSNTDCYPIDWADIEYVAGEGWLIKDTGQIVPFDKVQVSPDERFHICVHGGENWRSRESAIQYGGRVIGSPGVPHWCSSKGMYSEGCPDDEINPNNIDRSSWCFWVPAGG